MITVKLNEGRKWWHFETKEPVLRCPKCKKEYKSVDKCKICNVDTEIHIKERSGRINRDLNEFSCSCIFSSWWKFATHWKDNHPKSICKHCKWALMKIQRELKNEKR